MDSHNNILNFDNVCGEILTPFNVSSKDMVRDLQILKCKQAIEKNPRNSEFYKLLGNIYYSIPDFDKALENYNIAIELNENCAESLKNRAIIKIQRGDIFAAVMDVERAIEIKPESSVYVLAATILHAFGEHEKALKNYIAAMKLKKIKKRHYQLIENCFEKLNFEQVKIDRQDIFDLIKSLPQDKQIKLLQVYWKKDPLRKQMARHPITDQLYAEMYHYYKMIKYTQNIEKNEEDFFSYAKRGHALVQLKRYKEAKLDYNQVVMLVLKKQYHDVAVEYHEKVADVCVLLEEYEAAIFQYKTFCKLRPGLYFKLGKACMESGNREDAILYFTREIEESDINVFASYYRGKLYAQQKKYAEAILDFSSASLFNESQMELEIVLTNVKKEDLSKDKITTRQLFTAITTLPDNKAIPFMYKCLFKGNVLGNKMWENVHSVREAYGSPYENKDSVLYLICKYLEEKDPQHFVWPTNHSFLSLTSISIFEVEKVDPKKYLEKENALTYMDKNQDPEKFRKEEKIRPFDFSL